VSCSANRTASADREPCSQLLPALHAIVVIHIAGGPQSLVVQAGSADRFIQLFGKFMDGAEMVGCSGNLHLARFEELLVAAIHQARDLAVQQPARAGQYLDRAIRSIGDLRRTAVFPYLNGVCGALCTVLCGCNIESLTAKQDENVVEVTRRGLFCHKYVR
jgi:hypothetical protein